ncbi:MAG: DUF58 domain-containing protein [Chitinophagaceae bacterium]
MSRLPDPKIIMAIKDLSLAAKRTIDGFMAGINNSTIKGPGLEFSQYRSYQPGDDLRWLDWKMYARSDRYYIRESEIETSISVRFLIDASNSMNHKDDSGFSKIEYARYMAASLGYLAHKQGDSVGLYVFRDGELFSLPSKKDPQHMSRFFFQLEQIAPGGKFTEPIQYRHIFSGEQKRELLIFITDFYERDGEITRLLDTLATLQHEIIVFQLMGKNELEMDFGNYDMVEDLETGERVSVNSAQARKNYKEKLQEYLAALRMQLLDKHIFYRLVNMEQPLEQVLRDFLNQRLKSIV